MININIVECINFVKKNTDMLVSEATDMIYLNETEITNISDNLITALYKTAIDKYRNIDFGEIPATKGDFTRLPEYNSIMQSIELLDSIKNKVNMKSFDELDIVKKAIENVKNYKKQFELSYKLNQEIGKILYETISLAIIQATTFLIAVSVEFIRIPEQDYIASFSTTLNKKGNEFNIIVFRNLDNFNIGCGKGTITKFFNTIHTSHELIDPGTVIGILTAVSVAIFIVPVIRELIYQFFNTTMKLSKFFEIQARFIEAGSNKLKINKSIDTVKERRKVIQNQEKVVKKFNELSIALRGCVELADKNAKVDLKSKQSYAAISKPQSDLNDTDDNNNDTISSDLQLL